MELTEEEMRRALFGGAVTSALAIDIHEKDTVPDLLAVEPLKDAKKSKFQKALLPG